LVELGPEFADHSVTSANCEGNQVNQAGLGDGTRKSSCIRVSLSYSNGSFQ